MNNQLVERKLKSPLAARFRGFMPVVVDVETGGLDPKIHALLEVAAVPLVMNDNGLLEPLETIACHLKPFASAKLDPTALEINKIVPEHPFRFAVSELEGLQKIFKSLNKIIQQQGCQRAVLVGHNPTFDLSFLHAAVKRCELKHMPFHRFTTFDTATLSGLAYGETVLAKACAKANIPFNTEEAHSAIYDVEQTAKLFCQIVNQYKPLAL